MIEHIAKMAEIGQKGLESKSMFDPDKKVLKEKESVGPHKKSELEKYDPDQKVEKKTEISQKEVVDQLKSDYLDDVLSKSEYPETIDKAKAMQEDYRRCDSSETQRKRFDYNQMKSDLRRQWEMLNGTPWPRYANDVVDNRGIVIRRRGDRYDAHHVQPLELGGKNEPTNITPLSADVHYDHKGVHSLNSPFSKLEKELEK